MYKSLIMTKTYKTEKSLLLFTILLSTLVLLGWITNNLILTRISNLFIPTAPFTAVLVLVLSSMYGIWMFKNQNRYWMLLAYILTIIFGILIFVLTIDYFLDYRFDIVCP